VSGPLEVEMEVVALCESIARGHGLEVYDVVFRRSGPRWKLAVFLNRPSAAVTLADCETVSRQLARELDVLDLIAHSYDLEVSSPGIERSLRHAWHWERARGESVQVKWRDDDGRSCHAVGTLVSIDDGVATVECSDGRTERVDLARVLSAKLHADWK